MNKVGSHIDNIQFKKMEKEVEQLRRFVPNIVREAITRDPFHPSLERQMRDLSVLFMDISGCTRLCEVLSPERMQKLIEDYFSSFIDEVDEIGGTINETAGDGLMILFPDNLPGEHAISACSAAFLIHSRTSEFGMYWGEECRDFGVHIGINSGLASLGVMEFRGNRESRATFTASGPVTNKAARLGALAPRGKTYVGKETWERSRKFFEGNLVGVFELKNVSQPVEVYEITHPLSPGPS